MGMNKWIYRERGYDIIQCLKCGCMFAWPRPSAEELDKIYSQYVEIEPQNLNQTKHKAEVWDRLLKMLEHYSFPKGPLLDVGCGFGDFLRAAKAKGWTGFGIEVSKTSAELAKKEAGLNIFEGTLQEAKYPDGFFTAVTFNDVLEHLVNPEGALEEAARVIKTKGLLFVRVPNMGFHLLKFFIFHNVLKDRIKYLIGDTPRYFDTPLHLNYFTFKVLADLLKKKGFEVIFVRNGYPTIYEEEVSNLRNNIVIPLYYLFEFLRKLSFNKFLLGNALEILALKKASNL
jgi:2-polyprenyl-3-methyl-5-hydroxy-6-metoxy-1,4-benzoquinol methylase